MSFQGDDRPQQAAIENRMTNQEPEDILNFVLTHYDREADTLLLPCTAWRTFEIVDQIEAKTGLKVITANQATIWSVFKRLKLNPENSHVSALFGQTDFMQ